MNLLSRLEKLEAELAPSRSNFAHTILYPLYRGEDDDAKRAEALAEYQAKHEIGPDDPVMFIALAATYPGSDEGGR